MYDRALKLCSPEHLESELKTIEKSLRTNNFPKRLCTKILNERRSFFNNQQDQSQHSRNNSGLERIVKHISAPYIHGTSERMARSLRAFGIKLCHKTKTTIGS